MDSMSAFMMGEMNRGKEMMVFDWEKAANLINSNRDSHISAGLCGDWEYTGGTIWMNRKPHNGGPYLASTWATPEICIDGETYDCYKMENEVPEWGSDTFFPKVACDILGISESDIPTERE